MDGMHNRRSQRALSGRAWALAGLRLCFHLLQVLHPDSQLQTKCLQLGIHISKGIKRGKADGTEDMAARSKLPLLSCWRLCLARQWSPWKQGWQVSRSPAVADYARKLSSIARSLPSFAPHCLSPAVSTKR